MKKHFTMRAVEFKTRVKNNSIPIPLRLQSEMKSAKSKDVRVIILIDEAESTDEADFRKLAREQFLKGYDEADSVYDN